MTTATAPVQEKRSSSDKLASSASPLNVPVRNTSLFGATFNLTKSAVGAGTVFLPGMLAKLGPVVGSAYLVCGGALAALPLYFLGRLAHRCETGDYFKLGRLAFGKNGETAVSISLLLFLAGGLVAYSYLIGTYLEFSLNAIGAKERLPEAMHFLISPGYMTVFASVFIFMLSSLRDMNKLAKTSIFGMGCMLAIAGLLVYDAIFPLSTEKSYAASFTDAAAAATEMTGAEYATELARRVGKVIFAYVNHFTIVSLVPVMVDPSSKARLRLIGSSTGFAVLIYLMAGLGGYLRFGKFAADAGDILGVYGNTAPVAYNIARFALALVFVCSFPLLVDPARACLDALAFGGAQSSLSPAFRHYLETALIIAAPVTVAVIYQDKSDKVLDLFAGLCGSLLVFTLPGLFYLTLSGSFKFSISRAERGLAYFCIVLGLLLAIASTYLNVLELLAPASKA